MSAHIHKLTAHVTMRSADRPALRAALSELVSQRLPALFEELEGSQTIVIDQLRLDLGRLSVADVPARTEAALRSALDRHISHQSSAPPTATDSKETLFDIDKTGHDRVTPIALLDRLLSDTLEPNDWSILARHDTAAWFTKMREATPDALVRSIKHAVARTSSDAVVEKLTAQIPMQALAPLLPFVEPRFGGILRYCAELSEQALGPSDLTKAALREALQANGLSPQAALQAVVTQAAQHLDLTSQDLAHRLHQSAQADRSTGAAPALADLLRPLLASEQTGPPGLTNFGSPQAPPAVPLPQTAQRDLLDDHLRYGRPAPLTTLAAILVAHQNTPRRARLLDLVKSHGAARHRLARILGQIALTEIGPRPAGEQQTATQPKASPMDHAQSHPQRTGRNQLEPPLEQAQGLRKSPNAASRLNALIQEVEFLAWAGGAPSAPTAPSAGSGPTDTHAARGTAGISAPAPKSDAPDRDARTIGAEAKQEPDAKAISTVLDYLNDTRDNRFVTLQEAAAASLAGQLRPWLAKLANALPPPANLDAAATTAGEPQDPSDRAVLGQATWADPKVVPADTSPCPNGGLVLVWPFLPRLFETLALTEDGQFRTDIAQIRGTLALEYLAGGPPHDLATRSLQIEQLLCGCPPGLPPAEPADFSDTETTTMTDLLNTVRTHWSVMSSSSIDTLRETFLIRPGVLHRDPQDRIAHLRLSPGPYDMLLQKLPWATTPIRLPWMQEVLHVTWR